MTENNYICIEGKTLRYLILEIVFKTLQSEKGNRTKCAKRLDVSLRSIRNYIVEMNKLGWEVPKSGKKSFDFLWPRKRA